MAISETTPTSDDRHVEEITLVARGVATAVAPMSGLSDVQTELLEAVTASLTGVVLDLRKLEPLGPEELAELLADRDLLDRQRVVHDMVLGELVLRPIPIEVAFRVSKYAEALGVTDHFVRVARRYAQGAYGLAWIDLERNGFVDHVRDAIEGDVASSGAQITDADTKFKPDAPDPELAERWAAFEQLPGDTLGHSVWDMYDGRGFGFPGTPDGAPKYLAQHDFVHVLADYGTNLKGEMEVFAMIGRADPDPKGFAWLATLIGLFETGYITDTGFFERDVRERNIQAPGMCQRLADALRRGKLLCERNTLDFFDVDYYEIADRPVDELRERFSMPSKSSVAIEAGSAGLFDPEGMSDIQRQTLAQRRGNV